MSVTATLSTSQPTPDKREREESEAVELDDSALAKKARKDARVMRNRESAQRSRNQRKNELAYLQTRVVELEEENRRLRDQTPQLTLSPSTSTSSLRQATPEQRVLSLAGDLGIPPSMVSAGVNLSSVAPRHTEPESLVIKEEPSVYQPAPSSEIDRLISENRALLERIQTLESLVKQVVAMSDFSTVNVPTTTTTTQTLAPSQQTTQPELFDFTPFVNPSVEETPTLSTTLTTPTLTTPSWSSTDTNSIHPVACHSAAVAISDLPLPGKHETQQRARGTGLTLHPSLITKERLSLVARVIVASAKMRGWTLEGSSAWEKPARTLRRRNTNTRMRRKAQWSSGRRN